MNSLLLALQALQSILLTALLAPFAIFLGAMWMASTSPKETTNISNSQLLRVRRLMFIKQSARITPVGLHEQKDFFGDRDIQFKFIAHVDSINHIFKDKYVPFSAFKQCGYCNLDYAFSKPDWWNISKKEFTGTRSLSPGPGRSMSIGIMPETPDSFVVYVILKNY